MAAMRPSASVVQLVQDVRKQQILSAQLGLLYANANLGLGVTLLASTVLAGLQWDTIPRFVILDWWFYMALVSLIRYSLSRRYPDPLPIGPDVKKWRNGFAVGVGFSAAGWGGAGILLYPPGHLSNQVFLLFVLGGMMLGASSLLAARPEAFLIFLIPTGLAPAVRLFLEGDKPHFAMGLLVSVFTLALLVSTWRIYRTLESSLGLQIENQYLVEDLQCANQETEALNEILELRVQERTAELRKSTEQLRAEISQREQTEEELLRARKLESLGVLAGGIAHDFNNFLTIVQGNVEVAKTQLDPNEPAQEFLDQAATACQRAAFLSSQLLTFAKGGTPVRRVVSMAKLVTDAVQLARIGSSMSIEVEIAKGLWCAEVDPGQMGQVLHNILLNALQAMPEGGTIEVHAENVIFPNSADDADPRVRISIRDYGPGISPEVRVRIFDPYFTTKPGGSGLGLATAYAIVVKHGGYISVDSKPGAGTVFTIDLPASFQTPLPEPPVVVPVRTGTERLLVMDDEEALRILFKAVLTKLGYDVETARDGAEAVALYESAKAERRGFDAVLLDLTVISGMGGVETAAKLKEVDPSSKLIVSSGYSAAPVLSHFAEYGFDAVILKPWTVAEISEVLQRVLIDDSMRRTHGTHRTQ
jgi:signal transduction histidine kinase/ActR/RegA family two-component response regulator